MQKRGRRREQEIVAKTFFGATDKAHPAVAKILRIKEVLLGGRLSQKSKKSKLLAKRMRNRQKKAIRCS